jgi:DNA-binding Lrp family transcriptional regulator
MQKTIHNLTENEKKFLKCILENGSLTDVTISKKTSISKATCSRIRKKLEKTLISEYIPIIELDKVGINVFLVLVFKWNGFDNEQLTKKAFSEFEEDPRVIFLANGEGADVSTVMFMGFTDITQYYQYFKEEFRKKYDRYVNNVTTLLLPSKEVIKNDFTEIIKHVLKGGA